MSAIRIIRLLVLTILCLSAVGTSARAGDFSPTLRDRIVALKVSYDLRHKHWRPCASDTKLSDRMFEGFLGALDSERSIFNQSDVAALSEKYGGRLAKRLARTGDVAFAFDVYEIFLRRVEDRHRWVGEILAEKHDFDAAETLPLHPAQFPADDRAARDLWRRWIKYHLLTFDLGGVDEKTAKEKVAAHYRGLYESWRARDRNELVDLYLNVTARGFCPHTSYLTQVKHVETERVLDNREATVRVKAPMFWVNADGGKKRKIGLIEIPFFYGGKKPNGEFEEISATRDVRAALEKFKAKDVEAVVVDLRGVPGGRFEEFLGVSGLFVGPGPLCRSVRADGTIGCVDHGEKAIYDGKLLLVVDRLTASAAEGFADIVRDYRRGIIVGDRATYGKGTAQQTEALFKGPWQEILGAGALEVTIAPVYGPAGSTHQGKGGASHIVFSSGVDDGTVGEDKLPFALEISEERTPDFHPAVRADVTDDVLAELRQRLARRIDASANLQKVVATQKSYAARKSRPAIVYSRALLTADQKAESEEREFLEAAGALGRDEKISLAQTIYGEAFLQLVGDWIELVP